MFTRVFVIERKFAHAWGEQAVFWVTQAPKSTPVAAGLLLCFGARSSLGGHIFRLGSTSSNLEGERHQNAPSGAGLGWR